jgi:hypothetical protein
VISSILFHDTERHINIKIEKTLPEGRLVKVTCNQLVVLDQCSNLNNWEFHRVYRPLEVPRELTANHVPICQMNMLS